MSARRGSSFGVFKNQEKGEAPTDPIPKEGVRPSDVLINRLHELKRISKSLVSYFEGQYLTLRSSERNPSTQAPVADFSWFSGNVGLSAAHTQQAATILKLSASSILQTPFPESALFIPSPLPKDHKGPDGWSNLLVQIRDDNRLVAEGHAEMGRMLSKSVVLPLKKIRVDVKAHITMMEKEITKLADSVTKERETTNVTLSSLTKSVSISSPTIPLSSSEDPFLLRSAADIQMKILVAKENDLLKLVLGWQEKSCGLERESWFKVSEAWKVYEVANSNLLLSAQQQSVLLSAAIDSTPPHAEWSYFLGLNHIIPLNTKIRNADDIDYPHRDDPATAPLKQGLLDRQKRFVKSWKSSFFVLTPSGHLHEYPSSSAPLSKPSLSLALASCTLGPMPEPEANLKGRPLEPCFTIEAPDSRNVFRAKSWEELSGWWECIEKFTISTLVPEATTPTSPRPEPFENGAIPVYNTDPSHPTQDEDAQSSTSGPRSPEEGSFLHRRESIASSHSGEATDPSSPRVLMSPLPPPPSASKRRVPVPSPLAPNRPTSPIRFSPIPNNVRAVPKIPSASGMVVGIPEGVSDAELQEGVGSGGSPVRSAAGIPLPMSP